MDSGVAVVVVVAVVVAVEVEDVEEEEAAVVEVELVVGAAVAVEVGGGCCCVLGSAAGRAEGAAVLVAGTGAALAVLISLLGTDGAGERTKGHSSSGDRRRAVCAETRKRTLSGVCTGAESLCVNHELAIGRV